MIDWLLRRGNAQPQVELCGTALPLVLRRTAQAKRMTMRLAPDGSEVRITLPRWAPTAEALAFAEKRKSWLETQLIGLPRRETIRSGSMVPFRGGQLRIAHDPARPRKPLLDQGVLHLGGPNASLAARLKRWLEGEARTALALDLEDYCQRAGRPLPRLMLSNAQRRWGSCARDGTIRINWRLIMAPDPVRRSVVAHEVAHLVHFDHGPDFHALLAQLFEGDITQANRWLKAQGRSLYGWLA